MVIWIFFSAVSAIEEKMDEFATNQLLRNNGDGTFTDISEAAKINLPSRAVAVVPTDYDNRRDIDLLVLNRGGKPNLFRNLRDGSFKDVASEVGLNKSGDWIVRRQAISIKIHLRISFSADQTALAFLRFPTEAANLH